jgi:hypothetical protein
MNTRDQRHNQDHSKPLFKYIWNCESENKFVELLSSPQMHRKLEAFCATNFPSSSEASHELSNILNLAGKECMKTVRITGKKRKTRAGDDKFSVEIQTAKRVFKKSKRDFMKNEQNKEKRILYIKARKKYKQTINRVQKYTKEQNLHKLAELEKANPKSFWQAVKKLISPAKTGKEEIASSEWVSYFRKLLNVTNADTNRTFLKYVTDSLPVIERAGQTRGPLDSVFQESEINKAIKKLKRGKASGIDMIVNEMFICSPNTLNKSLTHLFNIVLNNGDYPKSWSTSIITPIHKSGD